MCIKIALNPKVSLSHEYLVSNEIGHHNNLMYFNDFGSFKMLENSTQMYKDYDYVVSDLMPNGDMFRLVSNNSFDENCARYLFKKTLKGVEYMHDSGYVHLDIKLGNILLDHNYEPKLTDFGFTTRIAEDGVLKSEDLPKKGTKRYMCPEIENDGEFDARLADVFSLGV